MHTYLWTHPGKYPGTLPDPLDLSPDPPLDQLSGSPDANTRRSVRPTRPGASDPGLESLLSTEAGSGTPLV